MITTVKKNKKAAIKKLPCLMVGKSGSIILATEIHDDKITGICLHSGNDCMGFGDVSENWDLDMFKIFKGKLILKNDKKNESDSQQCSDRAFHFSCFGD